MPEPFPEPGPEARVEAVREALGHRVADIALLTRACTHSSRCGAQSTASERLAEANERLEFLGDALLGGALCQALYHRAPLASEGTLSRRKSLLVSRATLARLIEDSGLLAYCLVGPQMTQPWPDSVKANLMESILAAIHLDGGWAALATAVERLYGDRLAIAADQTTEDAKTALQEWALAHRHKLPAYTCVRSGGSDHEPSFTATVTVGDQRATGEGGSRRRAEIAAAQALWDRVRAET
jgi:ribonuclease-3